MNSQEESEFLEEEDNPGGEGMVEQNNGNDSEAETIMGEDCYLNESFTSSAIITFKWPELLHIEGNDNSRILAANDCNNHSLTERNIKDMTPEELMEANPALKRMMNKLLKKDSDNSPTIKNKNGQGKGGDRRHVG